MKMITTGDIKISVLVDKADGVAALRAVHQAFGLRQAAARRRPAGAGAAGGSSRRPAARRRGPSTATWPRDRQQLSSMEDIVVSDVLLNTDQGRITIFDLPDQPGNCSRVFQAVAAGGIVVDMIVQNLTGAGPGRAVVQRAARRPRPGPAADRRTRSQASTRRRASRPTPNIAMLFVLGVGMRTHTGVARRMFGALAARGINISMINTSEVRVSVVVDRQRGEEALECLKKTFDVALIRQWPAKDALIVQFFTGHSSPA